MLYVVNQLPISPKPWDYVLLGSTNANGNLTLSESLDNFQWVVLIGQASTTIQAVHFIPVKLFAEGDRWYLNAYATTARSIYVTYSNATRVAVAGRSSFNVIVMGVR